MTIFIKVLHIIVYIVLHLSSMKFNTKLWKRSKKSWATTIPHIALLDIDENKDSPTDASNDENEKLSDEINLILLRETAKILVDVGKVSH